MGETLKISTRNNTLKSAEWLLIFTAIIVSRLLTSIYYIEEPDSMRFALALTEFDVLKLQPHFPGYPVFCWFTKLLYNVTGSMGVTFSIAGGLSVCVVLYSLTGILSMITKAFSRPGIYVVVVLVAFNPLLWVLSTSYMPDCMGAAMVCFIALLYCRAIHDQQIKIVIWAMFFTGLLAGTRVSYIPFVLPLAIYSFYYYGRRNIQILAGTAGVLIWLVPFVFITGFNQLFAAAATHTGGHFNDWGGSFITENNTILRFKMLIKGIWADGLGAYWPGRNLVTVVTSVLLTAIILLPAFLKTNSSAALHRKIIYLLFAGAAAYLLWILLGQNIIYKARHVLPLIPVLLLFIVLCINNIFIQSVKMAYPVILFFLASYAFTGAAIAIQHKQPTAIAQAKSFLTNKTNAGNTVILALGLVNDYLHIQGIEAQYVELRSKAELDGAAERFAGKKIYYIGLDVNENLQAKQKHTFYHNPYVNRMWPVVEVIEL